MVKNFFGLTKLIRFEIFVISERHLLQPYTWATPSIRTPLILLKSAVIFLVPYIMVRRTRDGNDS